MGNRDLNKLRLSSELAESDMERPIEDIAGPFWDRNAPNLKEYLEDLQTKKSGDDSKPTTSLEELNTRPERLRYMLKHTLGCPDTFEFRREEVQLLTHIYGQYPPDAETQHATPIHTSESEGICQDPAIEVTDEQVVDSFLYEISPEGSLRQYLHLSSIAAIVGNTVFVHGALDRLTMKYVPSIETKFQIPTSPPPQFTEAHTTTDPTDGTMIDNVHEWVTALNEYIQHGLKDFESRPEWNDERTTRGGEALMAIQNRPSMWGRSIVCNSYADGGVITTEEAIEERQRALQTAQEASDPLAFEGIASDVMDPVPSKWLLEHGIQRIVVGHKPTGDCAAVLSSKYTGVEIVAVDTSYSHRRGFATTKTKFGNNRGDAIAMVEIAGKDGFTNWLETSGVLACGTEYFSHANKFPTLSSFNGEEELGEHSDDNVGEGDPHLGMKLSDGWWVKACRGSNYHLCRGSGRFVEYDVRPMQEIMDDLVDTRSE